MRSPVINCALCGRPKAEFAFAKNGFDVYRCRDCRFLFVYPPETHTARIYSEEYFYGAKHGFGYVNYDEDKIAMRPFFGHVLDLIEKYKPSRGKLLDVGAATGFFLKFAGERGWVASGIEISPHAAQKAQDAGMAIFCGTLESVDLPENFFDAITLLDVLEHVSDPNQTLASCRRLLKPGGILFINTPDSASVWARIFGKRWHAYCPPEHLSYFNKKNMAVVLTNHAFSILRIGKISKRFTPAYIASMLFRWQKLGVWKKAAEALESSLFNRVSLSVNIRDNFFAVAQKEGLTQDAPRMDNPSRK